MSEVTETKPNNAISKNRKSSNWIPVVGLLLFIIIAILLGVRSGSSLRMDAHATLVHSQVDEQFRLGLEALGAGNYEIASQHLDFVAKNAPDYPGLQDALSQLALWTIMSPTPVPTATHTLTPTPDLRGADTIFLQAQQSLSLGDWTNAINSLDALRKVNPTYRTVDVDGMYYISLRERGWSKIFPENCLDTNLEGGIYDITQAERFGLLDNTALGVRNAVRFYLMGAAFWEVNWENSQYYFSQTMLSYPSLMDSTCKSAQERWRYATIERGKQYLANGDYCNAQVQFDLAFTVYHGDHELIFPTATDVYYLCYGYPPTIAPATEISETPTPTPTNEP